MGIAGKSFPIRASDPPGATSPRTWDPSARELGPACGQLLPARRQLGPHGWINSGWHPSHPPSHHPPPPHPPSAALPLVRPPSVPSLPLHGCRGYPEAYSGWLKRKRNGSTLSMPNWEQSAVLPPILSLAGRQTDDCQPAQQKQQHQNRQTSSAASAQPVQLSVLTRSQWWPAARQAAATQRRPHLVPWRSRGTQHVVCKGRAQPTTTQTERLQNEGRQSFFCSRQPCRTTCACAAWPGLQLCGICRHTQLDPSRATQPAGTRQASILRNLPLLTKPTPHLQHTLASLTSTLANFESHTWADLASRNARRRGTAEQRFSDFPILLPASPGESLALLLPPCLVSRLMCPTGLGGLVFLLAHPARSCCRHRRRKCPDDLRQRSPAEFELFS